MRWPFLLLGSMVWVGVKDISSFREIRKSQQVRLLLTNFFQQKKHSVMPIPTLFPAHTLCCKHGSNISQYSMKNLVFLHEEQPAEFWEFLIQNVQHPGVPSSTTQQFISYGSGSFPWKYFLQAFLLQRALLLCFYHLSLI